MKRIKKCLSIILAVLMLTGVLTLIPATSSAYTAHSQAEALAWVQSQSGQALDYDQSYGAQCVDLIMYYYKYLGVSSPGGNAKDYASNALPADWYRSSTPLPGDIVVWGAGAYMGKSGHYADGSYGHVGIVTAVNGGSIDYYDQNSYQYGQTVGAHYGHDASSATTYIHPDFEGEKIGIDLGDDFYALIINAPAWKTIGQDEDCNVVVVSEKATTFDKTIWHFQKLNGNNAYKITSISNGRCLDVGDASPAEGANVWTYGFHNNEAQYWYYMLKDGKGAFMAGCSSMYLDLCAGSTNDGSNVQMWSWNGSEAQQFTTYQITPNACNLDYNITVQDKEIAEGGKTKITVGGTIPYVYNYKFHIIAPDGKESVVDNGCNPVLDFAPKQEGRYIVYAEIKNPYNTQKGSDIDRRVLVDVGCIHEYTEKFVKEDGDSKPYILYTCSLCGKSYKDNYMEYKDGWYYTDKVPESVKNDSKSTVEYNNYYEKIQKDSPGENWKKGETITEWQNTGGQYDSYSPLPTSDSRVLVKECYYHWCIPGSSMGSEGNYEQTDRFSHYDEITLPNEFINVTWTGDDNGHTVYTLAWTDGNAVYCKSGEQCDGSWGSHDYRCKAWYKKYVYQDREKIEKYKYSYESGWGNESDSNANKVMYRFSLEKAPIEPPSVTDPSVSVDPTEPVGKLPGDVNGDGYVDMKDITRLQKFINQWDVEIVEQNSDVNGDGDIGMKDIILLQKYINKWDVVLK